MGTQIKGIKIKKKIYIAIVAALLICSVLLLTGCSGNDSLVGTWASEDGGDVVIFESDGTCSVPFTYDGSWWESCDRYNITDDGTLVLSSSQGNIGDERYIKAASREEVEENGGYYYLSGDTLVFRRISKIYAYTKE